ncbi:MAG: hypothetical protein FWF76_05245 [Oscillospiraceae bacterium]|nr:hypothetical protein [Oscillospiraceae bacterium]
MYKNETQNEEQNEFENCVFSTMATTLSVYDLANRMGLSWSNRFRKTQANI